MLYTFSWSWWYRRRTARRIVFVASLVNNAITNFVDPLIPLFLCALVPKLDCDVWNVLTNSEQLWSVIFISAFRQDWVIPHRMQLRLTSWTKNECIMCIAKNAQKVFFAVDDSIVICRRVFGLFRPFSPFALPSSLFNWTSRVFCVSAHR